MPDAYIAEFKMDRKDYVRGGNDIVDTDKKIIASQAKVQSVYQVTQNRLKNQFKPQVAGAGAKSSNNADAGKMFESALSGLSSGLKTTLGAVAAVEGAGLGAMIASSLQAANFDALVKSLEAVDGGAKNAQKSLSDLKQLAKAPGLGFEEAVRAYAGLRNADLSRSFSEKLISEFANANARAGGGKEQFDRVMLAIRQIAVKPHLAGQELMQLNEAGIPVQNLLKKHFGTGDSEELSRRGVTSKQALEGLLVELEKLPRVVGGAKNSIENLQDSLNFAVIDFGTSLNNHLMGGVDKAGDLVAQLTSGGYFASLGDTVGQALQDALQAESWGDILDRIAEGIDLIAIFARNIALNTPELVDHVKGLGQSIADGLSPVGRETRDLRAAAEKRFGGEDKSAPTPFEEAETNEAVRHQDALAKWAAAGDVDALNAHEDWLKKLPAATQTAYRNQVQRNSKKKGGGTAADAFNAALEAKGDPQVAAIEKNTRRAAEVLQKTFDATQRIIGGGAIGGKGITPIELGRYRSGGRGGSEIHYYMNGLIAALYKAVATGHDDASAYNLRQNYAD